MADRVVWPRYGRMFCQKATLCPGLDRSQLNSSLFVVTFLDQQNGRTKRTVSAWRPITQMRTVRLLLLPLKPSSCRLCRVMANHLVRTPTHERASLVGLAEVCASHGIRTDAHTTTAASATFASGDHRVVQCRVQAAGDCLAQH